VAVAIRGVSGEPIAALSIEFLISPETEYLWTELPVELQASVQEIERVINAPALGA
jgi:DNA-binding IclR family transcriptional regulator